MTGAFLSDFSARTAVTNVDDLLGRIDDAGDSPWITLQDVYRATEKRPALTTHSCNPHSKCEVARSMDGILTDLNRRLESALETELRKTTLQDLVANYLLVGT
jgi:DNA-binding IscR family transcriptional regulator